MNTSETNSSNLFKSEAWTESDAVHPRFVPETPEEITEYEKESYYYCQQCRLYFAPTITGLKIHFTKELLEHKAAGSCFYCKGKVYEYSLSDNTFIYHNCKDLQKRNNPCNTT